MATQRFGMLAAGRNVSLGPSWDFKNYTHGSWLGQADAIRKQYLAVGQRLHTQTMEIETAKAARREPKLADPAVRASLAKQDRTRLAALRNSYDKIEQEVLDLGRSLKPADDSDTSFRAAIVNSQLRDRLFNAKDDKARAELLQHAPYRAAMYEAPPVASNVSPMVYQRLRDQDIRERYPEATETIKQWHEAEQVLGHVFRAVESSLGHELVATGVVAAEQEAAAPQAAEEPAWA
jgi:hypothetical protein